MSKQNKKPKRWIYIYRIYFPTSRKCYIGQTTNLNRPKNHIKSKYLVGNAMRKYNDYEILILHKTKSQKKANKLEITAIAAYNSIAPNGYNIATGGHNGNPYAGKTKEEMKKTGKKMKKARKGKKPTLGKCWKHSKEIKANMRAAQNRPEVIVKSCLTRQGIKYTRVAAIKWLQERLAYYNSSRHQSVIVNGFDYRKRRIAKYEKWLKELQAS